MTKWLRLAGTILLLVSVTLPQYTCTDWVGPDGKSVGGIQPGGDSAAAYHVVLTRHYALETFRPVDPMSWLIVLTFAWPVPVLLYQYRGRRPGILRTLMVLEPLLALGSAYLVFVISSWGTRSIGGYAGLLGNGLYLFAWVAERLKVGKGSPAP